MQLLCVVLTKIESVPQIVSKMLEKGYGDPTVLNCEGAVSLLANSEIEPPPIFGILRHLVTPTAKEAKMLLLVMEDDKVEGAEQVVDEAVGGIENPNTGIMFTLPILNVKGLATR